MSDTSWHTTWPAAELVTDTRSTLLDNFGKARRETIAHYTSGPQTLAANADLVLCDLTSGSFTVNLPASPDDGDRYVIGVTTASGNTLTVGRGGENINGAAADSTITTAWTFNVYTYSSGESSWIERT